LFEHIERFIERGETNEWYEAAFNRLLDDVDIGFVRIDGPWAEMDTLDDLQHAREQR
jgi:NDP-sugar pyrophosphorylase family protein